MSTESNARGPLKLPRFTTEEQDFAKTLLSTGMPYKNATHIFLERFPVYLQADVQGDEVYAIIDKRLRRMCEDTRRISFHEIRNTKETIRKVVDSIPIASPLARLIEFEQMRQDPGLKVSERIRVLTAAAREVDRLIPPERTSGFGLPNLIPDLPMRSGSDTDEERPPDPFGGAIAKAARRG